MRIFQKEAQFAPLFVYTNPYKSPIFRFLQNMS